MHSMLMNKVSLTLACTSLGVSAIAAAPSVAQEPLLELHSVGMYDWPENAKDQKVMDAFKLMRDRLGDLAVEMDMDPSQAQMMRLGWDLLTARSALSFTPTEQGFDASFVLMPGEGNTEAMHQQVSALAMMGGMEFVDQGGGLAEAMGPMGPMSLGFDAERLWLAMGEGEPVSLDIPRYGLPEDVTPLISGRADIWGMLQMFAPEVAAQFETQSQMLAGNPAAIFIGPDAPVLEFAAGVDDDQMHMMSRMIGARNAMEQSGTVPALFTQADFLQIPRDATRVSAMHTNMQAMLEGIEQGLAATGENPLEEFNREVGIDLMDDVLANLGDRVIFYQSEMTGGGGLMSAVLLLDLRDAERMGEAHRKLVDRLNQLAEEEADGYLRVQSWKDRGVEVFSLTIPGLPIPFEPCWAIDDGKLVLALSPISIEAALAQMGPRVASSVLQAPAFRESILARMPEEGAAMVNYIDTPRMVAKGYGLTNMLTSAIANAARSPSEPDRVVGSLMPRYGIFTRGVATSGSISKWDGDDLVTHYIADRSMLVQLSAGLGSVADMQGLILPLVAGTTLPALGQARQRANEIKSSTQVRSLIQALIVYATNNNGNPPNSVQDLIEGGIITPELLISPMGSAIDGGPDYTLRFTKQAVDSFNTQYIVAIDRAAFVNGEMRISVGFADAHVEMIDLHRLEELLDMPLNEGVREDLKLNDF